MNLLLLEQHERELALDYNDVRAQHLRKVLKAAPGDRVAVGFIGGPKGSARIRSLDSHGGLRLEDFRTNRGVSPESGEGAEAGEGSADQLYPITILLGHVRPIVLKRLLRDLTSIGVGCIRVFPGELGEKSYLDSGMWRDATVRRQLIAGAEQAGVTSLPVVERFDSLSSALESLSSVAPKDDISERARGGSGVRLLLSLRGSPLSRVSTLQAEAGNPLSEGLSSSGADSMICAVGPERGFTPNEEATLEDRGFMPVSLGVRVLRTETAAVLISGMLTRTFLQSAEDQARGRAESEGK